MNKSLICSILISLCFCPYLARGESVESTRADTSQIVANQPALSQPNASNLPIPDITGWTVTGTSRVELRVSSDLVAYIGLVVQYSNPANSREFIRAVRRHIPRIISHQKKTDERLFSEAVIMFYSQKEEEESLREVSDKSDPVVYIQWRTKENIRNGNDMQDGSFNIWLLRPDGTWYWSQNKKEVIEFLSENISNGKSQNVFSGMKYGVSDIYHIIRINRSDLIRIFEENK